MKFVLPIGTVELLPLGDRAIVISLGRNTGAASWSAAAAIANVLNDAAWDWRVDVVPAYETVTVVYDPMKLRNLSEDTSYDAAANAIERRLTDLSFDTIIQSSVVREIPVCYGGQFGPDLEEASVRAGLSASAFIRVHAEAEYTVAMIGFMPGFPYMAGLPEQLAQPRKSVPRASVPAGSVGIAGMQTGIYPHTVPGGWQIIGRTNVKLFRPEQKEAVLLRAGDRIRFVPAEPEELFAEEGRTR